MLQFFIWLDVILQQLPFRHIQIDRWLRDKFTTLNWRFQILWHFYRLFRLIVSIFLILDLANALARRIKCRFYIVFIKAVWYNSVIDTILVWLNVELHWFWWMHHLPVGCLHVFAVFDIANIQILGPSSFHPIVIRNWCHCRSCCRLRLDLLR